MSDRPDPLESALRSAWDQGEPVDDAPLTLAVNVTDPDAPAPYALTSDDNAGKDTRDGNQPPTGASTLSSDVLDLLAAIRDALDVPYPRGDDAHDGLFLVMRRAAVICGALDVVLDGTATPGCAVAPIRSGIARTPVTYTPVPEESDTDGGDQ
ncbi:hypothetical protein ACFZAM_03015 [Streptomyces sp. NPDC008079]|uniref:hypothetical protein n=1 Tax=Streptomyces sp. NPDC008079 TaxID=3364806 RepID=UPI0036F0B321